MLNKIEVNLTAVAHNIEVLSKDKKACLVVKANAYGMNYELVSKYIEMGYNYFAVSTLEEAIKLREISMEIDILIMSMVDVNELSLVRQYNLEYTIYDHSHWQYVEESDKIHLKFDTGMGRIGLATSELDLICQQLAKLGIKQLRGVYSHLATADDEVVSQQQIAEFAKVVHVLKEKVAITYIHMYNTYGAANYDTTFDNMVRIGIGILGFYGSLAEAEKSKLELQPSLTLFSKVSMIKDYQGLISYGGTESVNGKVITLPIGYNDGIRRSYQGFEVANLGKIVGRVCMCQLMIKVDDNSNLQVGDEVILLKNNDFYAAAEHNETIVYELLVTLSNRIERVYKVV